MVTQQRRLPFDGVRASVEEDVGVPGQRGLGGSTDRTRKWSRSAPGAVTKAARPRRPVVRKIRRPRAGSRAAACVRSSAGCQRSPGPAVQPGRRSANNRVPVAFAAMAALALMVSANGWVASMTVSTPWVRSQSARPSGPPKPPTRTSPAGIRGRATRPASEVVTRVVASPPGPVSSAASCRASVVPPRIKRWPGMTRTYVTASVTIYVTFATGRTER